MCRWVDQSVGEIWLIDLLFFVIFVGTFLFGARFLLGIFSALYDRFT